MECSPTTAGSRAYGYSLKPVWEPVSDLAVAVCVCVIASIMFYCIYIYTPCRTLLHLSFFSLARNIPKMKLAQSTIISVAALSASVSAVSLFESGNSLSLKHISSSFSHLLPRHDDDDDSDSDDDDHDHDHDQASSDDGQMIDHHHDPLTSIPSPMDMSMPMPMPGNHTMEPSPVSMHGGGHHHNNWTTILDNPDLEPQQRAYWQNYNTTNFLSAPNTPNKFFLKSHIALAVIAWFFLYPLSVLISNVPGTMVYLPLQTLQTATNLVALLCLAIFGSTAPRDLYPNNFYSKFSIALLFISLTHWFAAIVKALAGWATSSQSTPMDGAEYLLANMTPTSRGHFIRPSEDSGHGNSSEEDDAVSRNDSVDDLGATHYTDDYEDDDMAIYSSRPHNVSSSGSSSQTAFETSKARQNRLIARIMSNQKVYYVVDKFGFVANIVFALINRVLFVLGYFYILTGVATFYRMGISNEVYGLLAHFIKGSVFFLYGILTLARYLGAFSKHGMAWNIAPGSIQDPSHSIKKVKSLQHQALTKESKSGSLVSLVSSQVAGFFKGCTMEFFECFLIFFYGSTNIFLEHLGNRDGKWSHKDLQHVSIAFMYLGGGLCGLIMESKYLRRLVNRLISVSNSDSEDDESSGLVSGRISINPIPAFTVFWTGVLMSMHEQMLPLATVVHMQWGYLLSIGSLFRFGTYILMYLKPPTSTVPSRPITEVVSSFCLLCGGMVFMESNSETVEALIYRNLDAMFTLNVSVGVTALIMSWILLAWAFKSFVESRQQRRFLSESV